jgi:hypothetical protein
MTDPLLNTIPKFAVTGVSEFDDPAFSAWSVTGHIPVRAYREAGLEKRAWLLSNLLKQKRASHYPVPGSETKMV